MNIDIKQYAKYVIYTASILCFILIFIFFMFLYPIKFKKEIYASAKNYNLNSALIAGIIVTESSFKPDAKSSKGAVGLMQLLPSTAQWICEKTGTTYMPIKLTNAQYNINLGCYYLRYLLDKFKNADTAIVAYNAGEGNVSIWLKDTNYSQDGITLKNIPFKESSQYLKKVKRATQIYAQRL